MIIGLIVILIFIIKFLFKQAQSEEHLFDWLKDIENNDEY